MSSTQENLEATVAPVQQEMSLEEIAKSCGFDYLRGLVEGSFGKVMVVRKTGAPESAESSVLKIVKKPRADHEHNIHELLGSHDNVIRFIECFKVGETQLGLQLELMASDLYSIIHSKDTLFPRSLVKPYLRQVVSGLEYMHSQKIAHLDLKPENVLVTDDLLKLGDFGLSVSVRNPNGSDYQVWSGNGTDPYRSPQACQPDLQIEAFPCDVWAVGILIVEMISRAAPWKRSRFEDDKYQKWFENKLDSRGNIKWNRMSPNLLDLVRQTLSHNPADRATLDDVKNHPWFLGNEDEEERVVAVPKKKKGQKKNKKKAAPASPPETIQSGDASGENDTRAPSERAPVPAKKDRNRKRNRIPTEEPTQSMEQQSQEDCFGRGKRIRLQKREFGLLQ